jgi:DNA-binding response OmpR family regulator
MSLPDYKVLIIDKDGQNSRRIADFLKEKGFDTETANTGEMGIEKIKIFKPKYVVVDLVLPDMNGFDFLDYLQAHKQIVPNGMKTLMMSSHNNIENVKKAIHKGACDYIIKPIKAETVLPRLIFHAQTKRNIEVIKDDNKSQGGGISDGSNMYLHLLNLVLKEANSRKSDHEVLFNMTRMLAITLKAVRCSLIQCDEDMVTGYVRASHDDINVNNIKIDLEKYPEVVDVMNREQVVVIENLDNDPVLAEIKKNFQSIKFNSMIVCPVYKLGYFYGVVSARMNDKSKAFSDDQIRFVLIMSQIISLILNSQIPLPIELRRPA